MGPFHVLSAWRAGLRSRSVQAILVLGIVLMGVAYLSSAFSPRQPKTVALDVGFSGIRISLVFFALFWIQELIGREIDRRTVLFALTYPVARSHYVIGRYLGVLGLLALAALLLGILLWVVVQYTGLGYEQGFGIKGGFPYWATIAGLWVDAAVVAAFALWIATLWNGTDVATCARSGICRRREKPGRGYRVPCQGGGWRPGSDAFRAIHRCDSMGAAGFVAA